MKKQKIISSDDITDQYLTDKIFVAKIIRVSFKGKMKHACHEKIPYWKSLFLYKHNIKFNLPKTSWINFKGYQWT